MQIKAITTSPANGGRKCAGALQRQVDCNPQPCPIDCEWSQWSGWNMCDEVCGPGKQLSRRHHQVPAEHGGAACEGPEERERACELTPCPIDCEWADWADWGMCDEPCGDGFQTRGRYKATHARYGGIPCDGPLGEEQSCNL